MIKNWNKTISAISRPVAVLLLVQLMSGIVLSPQGSFFPIYLEEQLGFAAVVISAGVAVGRLLGMIASIVGGALSDAVGRKWTFVLGLCGFVFGSSLFLIRVPGIVLLFWAASGFGLGFHSLGGLSYLIDAANTRHLGVFSALYHWGFTLGGALISPAAGALLDNWGFGAFGAIFLVMALMTVLGAARFLPDLPRGSDTVRNSWRNGLMGYGTILRRPLTVSLGLLRFLPTCYYGMATVINPLLINRIAGTKTAVALYATLSLTLATVAQMLVGRAADRWGHQRPTLVTFGVLLLAILGQASFANYLWSFFTFGVLGMCAAWSLSTLMPLLVSDAAEVQERGRVLGTLDLLWNFAMILGSLIGGALVDIAPGIPFFVTALLNLGSIVAATRFFRLVSEREYQDMVTSTEVI
jgi:MFS family permease